jgi:hypothetical protein
LVVASFVLGLPALSCVVVVSASPGINIVANFNYTRCHGV